MDYWVECISEAADEIGLDLTNEQIKHLAEAAEVGHDCYGMAFGYDAIPNPIEYEAERKLRELQAEKARHERWVNDTKPCRDCVTTGLVQDGWGRDVECPSCGGEAACANVTRHKGEER